MTLEEKDKYIEEHLMKLQPDTLRFMVTDLTAEVERLRNAETLRDRFAMAALQGMLASPYDVREEDIEGSVTDHFAQVSYNYADSMLKMRDISRTCGNSD